MPPISTILQNRYFRFAGLFLVNLLVFAALFYTPGLSGRIANSAPVDGGDTCAASTYILGPLPYANSGTTVGKTDNYDLPPDVTNPTCTAPVGFAQGSGPAGSLPRGAIYTGTGTGPDATYQLKMNQTCRIQVNMDPTGAQDLSLIVYLANCSSSLGDCVVVSDSGTGGQAESVQFEAAANQDYYIVIDGYSTGGTPPGPSGPYDLNVSEVTSPLTGCQPVGLGPEIEVLNGVTSIADGSGPVDFGTQPVGTHPEIEFTVENDGTGDLTLTEPISVPTGYTVSSSFGQTTLHGGESTTFTVQLSASSPGTYSGEVSFGNNDGDENPFNFSVTGALEALEPEIEVFEGMTSIADGVGIVDFGTHLVAVGAEIEFTVENDGDGDLTLTEPISVPAGYTVTSSFGQTTLHAGESTTFTVQLSAASPGTYSGELSFGNNDTDENPYNFNLTGVLELRYFYFPLIGSNE